LAGPIAIGAIAILPLSGKIKNQNVKFLKGIKDSKKLNAKRREEWYRKIKSQKSNLKSFCVFVSYKTIDKINIHKAALLGVEKVLKKFKKNPDLTLLDGSLRAPKEYKQKTIIRGDEKNPLIAAASIIAKVCRDRKMVSLHKKYPNYGFNKHKGYGTKLHYEKLKKNGPCKIHRKSYNIPIW